MGDVEKLIVEYAMLLQLRRTCEQQIAHLREQLTLLNEKLEDWKTAPIVGIPKAIDGPHGAAIIFHQELPTAERFEKLVAQYRSTHRRIGMIYSLLPDNIQTILPKSTDNQLDYDEH